MLYNTFVTFQVVIVTSVPCKAYSLQLTVRPVGFGMHRIPPGVLEDEPAHKEGGGSSYLKQTLKVKISTWVVPGNELATTVVTTAAKTKNQTTKSPKAHRSRHSALSCSFQTINAPDVQSSKFRYQQQCFYIDQAQVIKSSVGPEVHVRV